jgi:DNA-binding beta-propeller fold protein YncE
MNHVSFIPRRPSIWLLLGVCLASVGWLPQPARAGDAYKWSVQYIIDNSRTVFGRPQKVSPRGNRGLALSPDGKFLYAGYMHSFGGNGEVRRISLDSNDYDRATIAILPGPMGKAIATDDHGRVYISDENAIVVYDAELRQRQLELPTIKCEGIAVAREGGELVVYGSEREEATVKRWVLKEKDAIVTEAKPKGFIDGSGVIRVPDALDLRGLKEDEKGNLWIADLKGGKLFKMSRDGKEIASAKVKTPMDVAIDGGRVFVACSLDRSIAVFDETLTPLGTLGVPWEELELSPLGNNHHGGLCGIAALPGRGFFVANESGQTANQRSTYGRVDDHTEVVNGKVYRDAFQDDNEPILRATEVTTTPTTSAQ